MVHPNCPSGRSWLHLRCSLDPSDGKQSRYSGLGQPTPTQRFTTLSAFFGGKRFYAGRKASPASEAISLSAMQPLHHPTMGTGYPLPNCRRLRGRNRPWLVAHTNHY